jgi:phosphonoacetate hydrolase
MRRAFVAAFAVLTTVRTAHAAPLPPPAPRAADHVIVIMMDGTRPDLLRIANTPHLDALVAAGTEYVQARTMYPSQTRVAFVTLPTGAWPSSHGIMGGDEFMDAQWKQQTFGAPADPIPSQALVKRPTIFEEATAAGLTSVYGAMKGYELVGARGATWTVNLKTDPETSALYPTIYQKQVGGSEERAVKEKLRLSRVMMDRMLAILSDKKPNLMVMNLGSADYMAHSFGPGNPHYHEAFEYIDTLIGELLARLDALGIRQRTAIIVSADHGFSDVQGRLLVSDKVNDERVLKVLLAKGIVNHVSNAGGAAMAVYLRDHARLAEAVRIVSAQPWAESVYCESPRAKCDRTLSSLHDYMPGRSPDIMVDLDDDSNIDHDDPSPGDHGSLRDTDMRIPLIVSGAGVKAGQLLGTKARLLDVAPTAVRLLGLPGRVLRPDGHVLEEALAH